MMTSRWQTHHPPIVETDDPLGSKIIRDTIKKISPQSIREVLGFPDVYIM